MDTFFASEIKLNPGEAAIVFRESGSDEVVLLEAYETEGDMKDRATVPEISSAIVAFLFHDRSTDLLKELSRRYVTEMERIAKERK